MSKNHPIISAIDTVFSFNKARKKVFSALILAVIKTRDVNLMQLAGLLPSKASHESQYRKLQRFFEKWDFRSCELASFILSRVPKPEQGYKLNIDRTNWQYGKSAGSYRSTRKAKAYSKNKVFERELYFGCKSIKKGSESKLYIVSNKFSPHEALELYRSRWGIEVFFGHLKKKGFNFENTHMTEKKKIDKLLAVLAFAYLITVGWGLIMRENTHLNAHQKRKSVFRLGLDQLQKIFAEPSDYKDSIDSFKRWINGEARPSNFVV